MFLYIHLIKKLNNILNLNLYYFEAGLELRDTQEDGANLLP